MRARPRRHDRHHRRPAGDRPGHARRWSTPATSVICEAPTYPGAVPVFCSYQADVDPDRDGRGRDADRRARGGCSTRLDREGRRPKFIYTVPTFQNPAGVTLSRRAAPAPGRARPRARAARGRGQPLRAAALRGRAAAAALPARRRRLRHLPRHASRRSSRPGSGSAGRCAPPPVLEKIELGKQAADLCTSTLTQYFVREYFAEGALARLRRRPAARSTAAAATRCSTRSSALPARRRRGPRPEGGLFVWATLPDYIDTTRPAREGAARERRLRPRRGRLRRRPRRPARCGSTSPASSEDEIREGIRRIGKVVAEQVALYETITGEHRCRVPPPGRVAPAAAGSAEGRASAAAGAGEEPADEGRGAQGRALAGAAGLAALRRAGRGRARARSATRSIAIDVGARPGRAARRASGPTSPSSPCTAPAARTAPSRSCSRSSASPTPAPASRACMRSAWTRCWPSTSCATPASRRPTGSPSTRPPSASSAPPTRWRRSRSGSASRSWSSRRGQGSALGVRVRRARATRSRQALVAAFSYDDRVLLERHVDGPRAGGLRCSTASALPVVEAIPARRTSTTSRPATRSAAPTTSARPSSARDERPRCSDAALAHLRGARLRRASRAST